MRCRAACIDAGKAIGLTPWQRLIYVRLPTMLRITLPALSNTFISLFKDTSIASVIAVPELTYGAQWININTFRIVEVYRGDHRDVSRRPATRSCFGLRLARAPLPGGALT